MATARYAHAKIQIDGMPITEVTKIQVTETSGHVRVRTAGHIGVMKALGPTEVKGSFDIQIPRGGSEFGYQSALRDGTQHVIRWVDLDEISDMICILREISKDDSPQGERNCTVSFEGNTVA